MRKKTKTKKKGGKKRKKIRREKRWKYKQSHNKRQTTPLLIPLLFFLSLVTLHQECVLPLVASDAIVSLAEVHAVIGFVEHLEAQVSVIGFGQWGELSILLLPLVGCRPEGEETQSPEFNCSVSSITLQPVSADGGMRREW